MKSKEEIGEFLAKHIHVEPNSHVEADSFTLTDSKFPNTCLIRRGFRVVYSQSLINADDDGPFDSDDIVALIGRTTLSLEKSISMRFWNFVDESFFPSSLDFAKLDVKIRMSPRIQFVSRATPYLNGDNGLFVGVDPKRLLNEEFKVWEYHCACIVNTASRMGSF